MESYIADWDSQSWDRRALSLLAATKRATPASLKKLYYQLAPTAATHKLARPTMLPAYDWSNTRAFSLPTDQYGWIRVNLVGRESCGCVPFQEYDETCRQLETLLLSLTDTRGRQLVRNVMRSAPNAESALINPLPDLVVHWQDAAFAKPLHIKDSDVKVEPVGKKSTGQHDLPGFCILKGYQGEKLGGVLAAKDMGGLITRSLV